MDRNRRKGLGGSFLLQTLLCREYWFLFIGSLRRLEFQ